MGIRDRLISHSVAAAWLLVATVSSRGQVIGQMNEVDDDNNIVGEQPFLGVSFPSKKSPLVDRIRFLLVCIIFLLLAVAAIGGLVYLFKRRSTVAAKSKKQMKKSGTNSSFGFSVFTNDEETGASNSQRNTDSDATSTIGKIFGRARSVTPPPPVKKSFGQKVKGLFGIGKKRDSTPPR